MLLSIGATAAATNNTTVANGFNVSQISQSAGVVKSYVDTKYNLPNNITVGNKTVSNAQYLYLLTEATTHVANNNKSLITVNNISKATSVSETITYGTFTKSEYLAIAARIDSYIDSNNRLPNYVTTSIGTMKYSSLICMYSDIMIYYHKNNVLPATVSVESWYAQTLRAIWCY